MFLDQPIPQEPCDLWRWDDSDAGWIRLAEPLLPWSEWHGWDVIESFTHTRLPSDMAIGPGVYEIRCSDTHPDKRIYIGSSSSLPIRLLYDLKYDKENGDPKKRTHRKGDIFKAVNGQKDLIRLRWAPCETTDKAHYYEIYLGCRYFLRFDQLPDISGQIG